MIQWIALAVALDSNGKARSAKETAEEARHNSAGESSLVIVRPVDLVSVPSGAPDWNFLGIFPITPHKKVLAKEPWGVFSIKKSDIINIEEREDADGAKYCRLRISEYAKIFKKEESGEDSHMIALFIPGSIEEVAGAIGSL